jgi:hypothetical protein
VDEVEKLEFWTINHRFEVEPGEFELLVGASAALPRIGIWGWRAILARSGRAT